MSDQGSEIAEQAIVEGARLRKGFAMAVFKRGRIWWYKFAWKGQLIRESTGQTNKRTAEQIEAARKTALAKGEVGIKERAPAPSLKVFAERTFRPHVTSHFADKPKTLAYYETGISHLVDFAPLARAALDEITSEMIAGFVAQQRAADYEVSSINRQLQVLRRMFALAVEWGTVEKVLPRVRMLPGEKRRERVLSPSEQADYLKAAADVGEGILEDYQEALKGIRATKRQEVPIHPKDPFLLRDVATLLLECGLRPEECFRLRWEEVRDGALQVRYGKTASARRVIPLPERARTVLEMRQTAGLSQEWVFPAPTKTGHIGDWTIKKRHAAACKLAGLERIHLYTFRHTCLTRWATVMDPYTLAHLAGHSDFSTTRRYVHPQKETVLAAMSRAQDAQTGHRTGHSKENPPAQVERQSATIN